MHILTIQNKKEAKLLRKKTRPFDFAKSNKKNIKELIKEMRKTMKTALGIGLAANQVGLDTSFFVAQVPKAKDQDSDEKFYAIFNPKIVKVSEEKSLLEEGCLSVPGIYGVVERSDRVTLEGYNLQGKKVKIKAWGLLAQVFQHEVDHLDGKLFIDRTKQIYQPKHQAPNSK